MTEKKKYKCTNKAPIGTSECAGCSECCHEMGDTILQDPYDLWNFCSHMKLSDGSPVAFDILVSEDGPWELTSDDGMILPCLKMVAPGVCSFLDEKGRCGIHRYRSGLCRLYPLGRSYEEIPFPTSAPSGCCAFSSADILNVRETLAYYVLGKDVGCPRLYASSAGSRDTGLIPSGDRILISEYLGIPDIDRYEAFLLDWHKVKRITKALSGVLTEEGLSQLQQLVLKLFYEVPYGNDFYADFKGRIEIWNRTVSDIIHRMQPGSDPA